MIAKCIQLAVLSFAFSTMAFAACKVGTTASCTINGQAGQKECLGTGFGPCEPNATQPPPPSTGTMQLKYKVLTVIYAPPGTNGGSSTSQVSYSSGSTTGSTTTSSSSFKSDYTVSASLKVGDPDKDGTSLGGSFELSGSTTEADAIEIKKAVTKTITVNGPSADGVDHDRDQIWLWLNPIVDVSVSGSDVTWSFSDTSKAFTQFYYVGWLKNPSTMPAAQLQALQSSGITPADYAEILKADPFSNCTLLVSARRDTAAPRRKNLAPPNLPCATPSPSLPRYVSLNQWFPYEAPFASGDPTTPVQLKFDTSLVNTSTFTAETDYKVGASGGISGPLTDVIAFSLKVDESWTWTDIVSKATAVGTVQSISATVGGPAYGYKGPYNMIELYFDTIYQSFVFVPISGPIDALNGVVATSAGTPSAGTPVYALAGGKRYLTYTNSGGKYRFGRKFTAPVRIEVGSVHQILRNLGAAKSIDFRLN